MADSDWKSRDDGDTDSRSEPPTHPVPHLQGAFEESMMEALTDVSNREDNLDPMERRTLLLENKKYERFCAGRWKQKPGEKFHPLWKLSAQLSFGIHLLAQGLAKSEEDVMTILQSHVDDIDGFLERTQEDFDLAYSDISERLRYLKLPLEHLEVFEHMLEDKEFRNSIVTGNEKIEHIAIRTAESLKDALKDCKKGVDATGCLGQYLESLKGVWATDSPDFEAVYVAMVGNCEGWNIAFRDLMRKGGKLSVALAQLTEIIDGIQRKCGAVSRKGLVQIDATLTTTQPERRNRHRKSMRKSHSGTDLNEGVGLYCEKKLPTAPDPFHDARHVSRSHRSSTQLYQRRKAMSSSRFPQPDLLTANSGRTLVKVPERGPSRGNKLVKKRISTAFAKDKKHLDTHSDVAERDETQNADMPQDMPKRNSQPSSRRSSIIGRMRTHTSSTTLGQLSSHGQSADHDKNHLSSKIFGRKASILSRSSSEKASLQSKTSTQAPASSVKEEPRSFLDKGPDPGLPNPPGLSLDEERPQRPNEEITALPVTSPPHTTTSKPRPISSYSMEGKSKTRRPQPINVPSQTPPSAQSKQDHQVRVPLNPAINTRNISSTTSKPHPPSKSSTTHHRSRSNRHHYADQTAKVLDTIIATTTAVPVPQASPSYHRAQPSLTTIASVDTNHSTLDSPTSGPNPARASGNHWGRPSISSSISHSSSQKSIRHPLSPSLEAPPPPPPGGRKMVEPDYASARGLEGERKTSQPILKGSSMSKDGWKKMFSGASMNNPGSGAASASNGADSRTGSVATTGTGTVQSPKSSNKSRFSASSTSEYDDEGRWFKGMDKDGMWVSATATTTT